MQGIHAGYVYWQKRQAAEWPQPMLAMQPGIGVMGGSQAAEVLATVKQAGHRWLSSVPKLGWKYDSRASHLKGHHILPQSQVA